MPSTHTTDPSTAAAARFEAEMFTSLARNALRRADMLLDGVTGPDPGTLALAKICATTIEEEDNLGLERGSDWVDDLLDMMQLLARKGAR
jgi:hypothetical protein